MIDPYIAFLLGLGLTVLAITWLPLALKTLPLSLAIVCVGLGAAIFGSGLLQFDPDPRTYDTIVEKLSEAVIIIALMGAGLKIDRKIGLRSWMTTWRLLGLAMPVTIIAVTLLSIHVLGLPVAMSLLLGAALAPTDPVLASDVQVSGPRAGREDEVRFGLTSEAGLNDGLAFPFVYLAILFSIAAATTGGWPDALDFGEWFARDVVWRIGLGVGAGWLVGRGLGWFIFDKAGSGVSGTRDGLGALGATLIAYALAEICEGYGFLAVFVSAIVLRNSERDHEYHESLHDFSEQIERLLMMLVLILFGGAITMGLFDSVTWTDLLAAIAIVFLIRPLAGWMALIGSGQTHTTRGLISFFGIRGIGSFYYVAYGINHGDFGVSEKLWAITGLVVLISIVVHGISVTPAMRWLKPSTN